MKDYDDFDFENEEDELDGEFSGFSKDKYEDDDEDLDAEFFSEHGKGRRVDYDDDDYDFSDDYDDDEEYEE